MYCEKIKERLSAYLDGMLDEGSVETVEAHLAGCAGCRGELEAMRMLVTAASGIEPIEPPRELRAGIAAAVATRKARAGFTFGGRLRQLRGPKQLRVFRLAAGAAAAGLAALFIILQSGQPVREARHVAGRDLAPKASDVRTVPAIPQAPKAAAVTVAEQPAERVAPIVRVRKYRTVKPTRYPAKVKKVPTRTLKSDASKVAYLPTETDADFKDESAERASLGASEEKSEMALAPPTPEPAAETNTGRKSAATLPLVKVAAAPSLHQEDTDEWAQRAKTEAAMHKRARHQPGVEIICTRF